MLSWQICGECRGCPASSYHKKKCVERNEEHDKIEQIKHYEQYTVVNMTKKLIVELEVEMNEEKLNNERLHHIMSAISMIKGVDCVKKVFD